MSGKIFFDTNILAYASDKGEPRKQKIARKEIRAHPSASISTQVLQEFFVTATKKLNIEPLAARDIMATFRGLEVVVIEFEDVIAATEGSLLWQLSFWDALVITAARKARCQTLLSEDLNDGQTIAGIQIRNPFR
jgi:predicted nucleic acid-binding protein